MRLFPLLFACLCPLPAAAVTIDGHIDPAEWQGARHVTDFRVTQPLTGAPASYPTEAWILATPEGLAVAFRNVQPPGVPRSHRLIRRDEQAQVDRDNLMVDFDGDGRTGYDFMVTSTDGINDAVITNQNRFSTDWDGNWRHAASEDAEGWSVEMLIPWYIAPMAKGGHGHRTLRIYLDRVVGATGERAAWPAASYERPRFLSDFAPVEVPLYSEALFAVTPYASALYDHVAHASRFDEGADILWKPNGQFQLTATVNPDFGQVESDNLVVNFGANETFFSDKRPFFTENQGPFEFTTPSDNSQLVYTRRVGGPADDGSGAGDITAAVKLNGSFGANKYGFLLADEADAVGRSFAALRLSHDFTDQNVGMLLTRVEHPFLDRDATVLGLDQNWRPTGALNVQNRLIVSNVDQQGVQTRGSGFTSIVDYEMRDGWRQQWIAMHFGDDLQVNDFGYLSRANLDYGHWQVMHRVTGLPQDSTFASHDWRWRVSATDNDHGLALQRQFRASVQSVLRDGGAQYAQVNLNAAGYDDRILRGNGIVRLPPSFTAFFERSRPRQGDDHWELYANLGFDDSGLGNGGNGNHRAVGFNTQFKPTYFLNDAFSVYTTLYAEHNPQWMVWSRDNLLGSFDERALQFDAGVNWNIGNRQEMRVKLQALGLDAKLRQGWRAAADGTPLPVANVGGDRIDDFSLSNLGFQVRYRYELAPLSYLYVVYGRGGDLFDETATRTRQALSDAFSLRDSEQLLVKLSYRFEL